MANLTNSKIFITCALVGAAIGIAHFLKTPSSTRREARHLIRHAESGLKKIVRSRAPRKGARKTKRHVSHTLHSSREVKGS